MKLLHLGDLHIGRSLADFDLIEDQKYIFDRILELIDEHKIDAVLMAGDIYDKPVPSEAAVRLFDYLLREIAGRDVKVFAVSGNHDSDERLHFGSSFFEAKGIYMKGKYEGEIPIRSLQDEYGYVNFYLLPFVKASHVKRYFPEAGIESYDDAVRTLIEHTPMRPEERNVILAHQFVVGSSGDKVRLGGSEGLAVQNVGTVEQISYHCFDAFDYVALGHIHSAQSVGRREVRYSGSPLKYSLSEVNSDKSVPIITLGPKGEVELELIPLVPKRNLRHIRGEMKQLLDQQNLTDRDDFIYVTLTDEDFINDAMGIFQQYYPNTLRIDYENSHTRELDRAEAGTADENRSFEDMIREFYKLIYGQDMTEDEMAMIKEAAEAAGVEV